jgi:hypothetical protein
VRALKRPSTSNLVNQRRIIIALHDSDTEADARAKMLVCLLDNNLIAA